MAKAFILDDQTFYRRGLRGALAKARNVEIVGEGTTQTDMVSAIESNLAEVVLLGAGSDLSPSIELCRRLKQMMPAVGVILLAPEPHKDDDVFQAIKAQAAAFLSRDVDVDQLVTAILRCAQGQHPINDTFSERPGVAEQILQQFHELSREREASRFISPLTPRETEILHYMAEGLLNKQIADKISVTEQTIKNHITSILRKLNANARTHAVVIGIRKGLITVDKEQ
jgi:DNA-binding NarL/FixJ family response regulator